MNKPVLSPRFKRELADNNPIGMLLTEDDVQAWFDLVWLKFSTYNYRQGRGCKSAIVRWWSRVRESEIDQARTRAARIADEHEVRSLDRQAGLVDFDRSMSTDETESTDHASRFLQ